MASDESKLIFLKMMTTTMKLWKSVKISKPTIVDKTKN